MGLQVPVQAHPTKHHDERQVGDYVLEIDKPFVSHKRGELPAGLDVIPSNAN